MLIDAPKGLKDVVVTTTLIGDVNGAAGYYHYREHDAIELARTRSFEDVWFLFVEGRLPGPDESARFAAQTAELRQLPATISEVLPAIARSGCTALAGLRTALSMLPSPPMWDAPMSDRKADALRVSAMTPTILAALHRLKLGLDPVSPRVDLSTSANWLYMLTGQEPSTWTSRAVEQYLIATIDHGFNASTFTARVVASAGADVVSAVTAAIGTFSGPLHGGAPDRALEALDLIGSPDNIDAWVRERIEQGDRIMGFGHAVYKTEDPRARLLKEIALERPTELTNFAVTVERRVTELLAELKPGRQLYANVEFYAGVVMELCGIPREMFTPTFACSRVIGWCANALEQSEDTKIIRPVARYTGPQPQIDPTRFK
ncbi:citrate synthase/methylcitrate synthase [Lentzea nigeriaca]|uniref:citrate synthase/methylcitrate synthase n=1 Tax=Lentzea nigeriaca TaxID=1128665 RepID=UPI001959D5FD|nr:citrate synthase/methylcitrate synthase [Lentzea nigeriaca]MBM7863126.1 citrate synthase [Lentzea nigeriaca]